jgi:hypothetical protein
MLKGKGKSFVILVLTAVFLFSLTGAAVAKNAGNNNSNGKANNNKIQEKVIKFMEKREETSEICNFLNEDNLEESLENIEESFENIENAFESLEDAIENFEEVVKENPKAKKYYKKLGKLYQKTGQEGLKIFVQGKRPNFDQPPVIKEGRTLIPVRAITQALGAEVSYDNETKEVTITRDDSTIILKLDSVTAVIDGEEYQLDVPAAAINGRTVIPLRFVSQALNSEVEYDGKNGIITIIDEEDNEDEIDEENDEDTEDESEENEDADEDESVEDSEEENTDESADESNEEQEEDEADEDDEESTDDETEEEQEEDDSTVDNEEDTSDSEEENTEVEIIVEE